MVNIVKILLYSIGGNKNVLGQPPVAISVLLNIYINNFNIPAGLSEFSPGALLGEYPAT